MDNLRIIELKDGDTWKQTSFDQLKSGQIFRMFEPDGAKERVGELWLATSDPYLNKDNVWEIEASSQKE